MAKGFISIKQVPQDLRSKGAEKLRGHLREMLSNPFLPAEQRAVLESKLGDVAAWESGKAATASVAEAPAPEPKMALKAPAPAPELPPVRNALVQLPARQPQHHTIEITESLSVSEEPPPPPPAPAEKPKRKRKS